jgi:hypothetical protein
MDIFNNPVPDGPVISAPPVDIPIPVFDPPEPPEGFTRTMFRRSQSQSTLRASSRAILQETPYL